MTRANSDADGDASRVHGNALIIGDKGVLLRGPSGSGKSALTLALIAFAEQRGVFSRLIGDDRIELGVRHGRLIARPHPTIAGMIEARGIGILRVPHEAAGVIRLVVDLVDKASPPPPRLPPEDLLQTKIRGVAVPRLWADASNSSAPGQIFFFFHNVVAK
jgi:HPr kinase/phosphorylase